MVTRRFTSKSRKALRTAAMLLALLMVFSVFAVTASAYEVKGNTLAEVLGMDGAIYYQWLKSHENDTYYNTTPYEHADHRNPNGDCDGANGVLDTPGVPALNCMGFVWHALYMPTLMSGGDTDLIPAYGKGGWYGLYYGYDLSRRYFDSKAELLNSGYAEPGDIIWMFVENEHVADDSNHIAIYMGDGHSDRVWHAVKAGCEFGYINPTYEQYLVIKSGVIRKLDTPVIKSVVNADLGPKITWNKVSGATWYKVFVRNGSKWKELCYTRNNYFVDKTAKSGRSYTYTVRCCDNKGKFMSDYDKNGKSVLYYAAPGSFNAECSANGIRFSWSAVECASKYRVYRRTAGSDWQVVARTAETSFLDTKVEAGKPYLYTVRTLDSNNVTVSGFRTPLKAYIISDVPKISGDYVSNAGLTLTWDKIKGAEKYVVYKRSGASWKRAGVTDTNSFTYQTPDRNVETVYTVRCLSGTGNAFTSGYDKAGYTAMFQSAPAISRLEAVENGVKLTWSAQENAENYRIYRKEAAGKWTVLADTDGLSYVDTTAATGKSYTYTLRVLSADGKKLLSGFDSKGASLNYAAVPAVTAAATDKGIRLSWNKVPNASVYRVFVKKDGAWRGLANTKSTEYPFTGAESGVEYTFTVRCVDSGTKWFNSSCNKSGVTAVYVDPNAPTEATEATEPALAETGEQETEAAAQAPAEIPAEAVTEPAEQAVTELPAEE